MWVRTPSRPLEYLCNKGSKQGGRTSSPLERAQWELTQQDGEKNGDEKRSRKIGNARCFFVILLQGKMNKLFHQPRDVAMTVCIYRVAILSGLCDFTHAHCHITLAIYKPYNCLGLVRPHQHGIAANVKAVLKNRCWKTVEKQFSWLLHTRLESTLWVLTNASTSQTVLFISSALSYEGTQNEWLENESKLRIQSEH